VVKFECPAALAARFTFVRIGGCHRYSNKKARSRKQPGEDKFTDYFQARRATPITNVTRNTTRNRKKRIFAILAEAPAIDPNPKTAATIAMRKKIKA
jgi:hypothetical protein